MRKKLNLFLFVSVLFGTTLCSAQVNTDLKPQIKSPEVNKFEQYMNMPVNLVSGTPQVSIPLYTLEYGGMKLPISLDYDASGVKVESIASSVGQNWSLNVGGVVSRIVKGAPDEGSSSVTSQSEIAVNGYYKDYGLSKLDLLLNGFSNSSPLYSRYVQFNYWLADANSGKKDSQPDLFYFSTPEGGSKFVFNEQRNVVYTENTDFIIKENFVDTYFKTWTATSPGGIKYKYGIDSGSAYGNGNVVEKNYSATSIGELLNDSNFTVNSWFLSEVSNYMNTKTIQLGYIDSNYSYLLSNKPTKLTPYCLTNSSLNGSNCDSGDWQYGSFAIAPFSTSELLQGSTLMQNNTISKLISTITAGSTVIQFNYSTRDDLTPILGINPKKLEEIVIYSNSIVVKKIKFSYTTVQSSVTNRSQDVTDLKRLRLDSVIETSSDEKTTKPYVFIYNSTPLPSRLSYAQDKWGYFNGKNTNPSLLPKTKFFTDEYYLADRGVSLITTKAMSLEKIIYPTKGSVNFEFESHANTEPTDFYIESTPTSNLVTINPLPSSSFGNNAYNETTFTYSPQYAEETIKINSTLMFPSPLNGSYNPGGTAPSYCSPSSANAVEVIDNTTNVVIATVNYSKLQLDSYVQYGTTYYYSKSSTISTPIDPSLLVSGHSYTVKVYGIGNCYYNTTTLDVHKVFPIYDVGGLRLKKVVYKNFDNSILKQQTYTYLQPRVVNNPVLFSKVLWNFNSNYLAKYFAVVPGNAVNFYSTMDANLTSNNNIYRSGYYYHLSTGTDPLDINFMGPAISYGEVRETDGNGTTIHIFNRYKNYLELNNYNVQYSLPPVPKMQSILAGEKQSVTEQKNDGTVLKSTTYDYNYSSVNTNVKGVAISCYDSGLSFFEPYYIQGQLKNVKTETVVEQLGTSQVTSSTSYTYNGTNHFQPSIISKTNSKGEELITKMYYSGDLLTQNQSLFNQNRKSTPLKTELYNSTTKLSEQQTTYTSDATTGSLLLPKSVYASKFPNSLATLPGIGNLERKVTSDYYDTSGNLTQYTPEGGAPVSIVWGYDKTQPIAKIENATNAQLVSALGVSDFNAITEAQISSLNNLRTNATFSQSMITTYTYQPLVGVTSITDPKGDTVYYTYDGLGRLQYVKDAQGKLLTDYQYHYKN